MRLTKRQLKRIIREEYSRLKRKGLIRENAGLNIDAEKICGIIMQADSMGDYEGYCGFAEEQMDGISIAARTEMADEELVRMGIFDGDYMVCPPTAQEFCDLLRDPAFQNSPVGQMVISVLT
jgi:hypothetical protein